MTQEMIVSIASVVIALSASAATIWQAVLTRRHNRLSVRPHLRIDRSEVDVEGIKISVLNTGVGPAIVESFQIKVDNEVIEGNLFSRMQNAWTKLGLQQYNFEAYFPVAQEAFGVGECQILIVPRLTKPSAQDIERIRSVVPRLTFTIGYTSIYGDQFLVER